MNICFELDNIVYQQQLRKKKTDTHLFNSERYKHLIV